MKRFFSFAFLVLSTTSLSKTVEDLPFDSSSTNKVDIETSIGNITVSNGTPSKITYTKKFPEQFNTHCELRSFVNKNTFYFKVKELAKNNTNYCSVDVELSIPATHELEISTNVGDINFMGSVSKLKSKVNVGNLKSSGKTPIHEVSLGTGNAIFTLDQITRLEARVGTGNIEVATKLLSESVKLKMNAQTGDISLKTEGKSNIAEIELKTGIGNISASFPANTAMKTKFRKGVGEIKSSFSSNLSSKFKLEAKVGVGNIEISKF